MDAILEQINIYVYSIVMISYTIIFSLILWQKVNEFKLKKNKFFDTTKKGIHEGLIKNINDLRNVYLGIYKREINEKSTQSMSVLLKELYVEVVNKASADKQKVHNTIKDLITENSKISPFADLPELERNILIDISNNIREQKAAYISSKLKELSKIIFTRFQDQEQANKRNKISYIITIVSVVLTIFFGLLSIIKI